MSTVGEEGTEEEAGFGLEGEFDATATIIGGRYRLRRRLDREGGGLVVLADDDVTGRQVVIDFVDVLGGGDDVDAVGLLRESAAATLVLKDPAILHTTDFVEHQNRLGVVSEYVVGNDLASLLRRGPLLPSEAARIGAALARALASIHHAGITHGLLTPRDVLIDEAGGVHVANTALGVSGLVAPAPVALAAYGAPEQLAGRGGDATADLYSLGVLLYEMVIGQPPFSDWDATVLTQRKLHEPAPVPSQAGAVVPADYDGLVARLLDPRPVARPDADEAAVTLARLEAPVIARTPTPMRRRRSMRVVTTEEVADSRRELGWWVAATAALVVGIVVLVAVLLNRDDPKRVLVPNVVGRPAVVAIARLRNDGFKVSTLQAPNNGVLAGVVADQSPAAGRRVKEHAAVVVTISTGPLATTPAPPPLIVEPSPTAETSTSTSTSTTTSSTTSTTTAP
jgi:Serine/threonine protein kinase